MEKLQSASETIIIWIFQHTNIYINSGNIKVVQEWERKIWMLLVKKSRAGGNHKEYWKTQLLFPATFFSNTNCHRIIKIPWIIRSSLPDGSQVGTLKSLPWREKRERKKTKKGRHLLRKPPRPETKVQEVGPEFPGGARVPRRILKGWISRSKDLSSFLDFFLCMEEGTSG